MQRIYNHFPVICGRRPSRLLPYDQPLTINDNVLELKLFNLNNFDTWFGSSYFKYPRLQNLQNRTKHFYVKDFWWPSNHLYAWLFFQSYLSIVNRRHFLSFGRINVYAHRYCFFYVCHNNLSIIPIKTGEKIT